MGEPVLSIVVLSWNTRDLTLACLRSLYAHDPERATEVIVIDNASHDGSADAVAVEFPQVRLTRNAKNLGYAGGNNQGARLAHGEYLLLLNSDTEVPKGATDRLVEFLETHSEHGAVAPRLNDPDGTVQRACMRFPGLLTALCFDTVFGKYWPGSRVESRYRMEDFDHVHSRDVDQPPGAVFLMQRQEYLDMGGLDEELFLFFNDVDICKRLRKRGRKVHYLAEPEVAVTHHGGASTKGYGDFVVTWHRNRLAYYRKHYGSVGMIYMRLIVRWRSLEEWWRMRKVHKNLEHRRTARNDLAKARREILKA